MTNSQVINIDTEFISMHIYIYINVYSIVIKWRFYVQRNIFVTLLKSKKRNSIHECKIKKSSKILLS